MSNANAQNATKAVTTLTRGENELKKLLVAKGEKDLYAHVTKVCSHIVRHQSHDALNKLEEVSHLLKEGNGLDLNNFLKTGVHKDYSLPADDALREGTKQFIADSKTYFKSEEEKKDDEGNIVPPEAAPPIGEIPDLRSQAKLWQWANINFGDYDVMLLQKSLKLLVAKTGASQMRLWGKIRGTEKDYYVAEGKLDAGGEEGEGGATGLDDEAEARGSGVNIFVYWVTNNSMCEASAWTQLPDLNPKDIRNARSIKYCLSGDVNKKLFTNPFYFETEKTYLRAQIARIQQSTTLVPKTLFRFVEESDREIEPNNPEEGELVKPSSLKMKDINMWLHHLPSILKQCRTTHKEPKAEEGEEIEPEDLMKREVAKDPWEPRLKPIVNDQSTIGGMPAWIVRSYNANDQYSDPKTIDKKPEEGQPLATQVPLNYGCVVVKSMWWPGAFTFYNNGNTQQVYCGDGQKHESQTYYPVNPPVMMEERDEVQPYDEPNPTEEWLARKAELEAKKNAAPEDAE